VWYLCDFFGRKKALIGGCAIVVIGAIVQGTAQDFGAFIGGRILLGIGSCLASTAAGPLITECAYPTQRATVTAMLLASWPFGAFIAALVTWGTYNSASVVDTNWSWRIPSLLQGLLPLIQILIAFFGPESPRWLIDKGQEEKARNFFVKYHGNGDESSVLVNFQMAEIAATIEAEKAQKLSNWKQWFITKGMRHRFFIVAFVPAMLQLEGNALISYYLHIILDNINITNSIEQLKINLGITVFSLVTSVAIASLADRLHRRTMFFTGLISMGICYVIWTILSAVDQEHGFANKSLSIGVVAMIFIYSGFGNFCATIGTPYVMEVSPYSLRASASTIYQLTGNVAGLFNNYVNPIAMAAITWKYYIVWCCWLPCLVAIVYFFFPETYGKALEEIDSVFGGELHAGVHALRERAGINDIREKAEVSHADEITGD
jgi:sugar porter (SP) family MFS transporter